MELGDLFCPRCGNPQPARSPAQAAAPKSISCRNCGAPVPLDPGQRSYTCSYCGSSIVVEAPGFQPDQQPEFVLPFALSPEKASQAMGQFLRSCPFVPKEVYERVEIGELRGVYLPCWHFAVSAESVWSALIGEYWYRTETYTVVVGGRRHVRTRQVRETEWWPLQGKFQHFWSGYLVPATPTVTPTELEEIGPFHLEGLKRYRPEFLAGWGAENPSISKEDAFPQAEQYFEKSQRRAISEFLPGDTYRKLQVETTFTSLESHLTLVPVYILTFQWRGSSYRLLMNGQTAKVAGSVPQDWKTIALVIGAVLVGTILLTLCLLTLFG